MQARHWPILVRVWSARCSDVIFLSVWTNASAIPQSSLTCQACSGGIGRNVLNLLSIYFTFFGKVGRAVAAWAFPGADHPTSSLSGGHRSDEAGGSRAHECSPRAEIRREFHALFETEKKRHLLEAKKKNIATWGTVTGQPVPSQAMHTVLGPVTQAWMAWERRSKVSHNSHRTHTSVIWKMMHYSTSVTYLQYESWLLESWLGIYT